MASLSEELLSQMQSGLLSKPLRLSLELTSHVYLLFAEPNRLRGQKSNTPQCR